jgi:hypothetical protein
MFFFSSAGMHGNIVPQHRLSVRTQAVQTQQCYSILADGWPKGASQKRVKIQVFFDIEREEVRPSQLDSSFQRNSGKIASIRW